MSLTRAIVEDITVFGRATFEPCKGVNVIIGANGTGKTHLLKLLYAGCTSTVMNSNSPRGSETYIEDFSDKLKNIFKPDANDTARLIRRGCRYGTLQLEWSSGKVAMDVEPDCVSLPNYDDPGIMRSVFLPPREVLSMFPGFIPAYEERELSFDETYYDICKNLMRNILKKRSAMQTRLVKLLEKSIGGSVVLDGTKFYLRAVNDEGKGIEATLMSDGMRKIAMLSHLINNGSIRPNSLLFWDEPESSLNPKMIPMLAQVLFDLARFGVQIFIATHDYLLTRELSLIAEQNSKAAVKYFCLTKSKSGSIEPESSEHLVDLQHNPILEEFLAHYDRERSLFLSASHGEV